jgi:Uma2 family endonuclease
MTLSFEHERYGHFLGRMVVTLTEELDQEVAEGGSVTLRRRKKQRGLESHNCYWIQNEHLVRDKKIIDLRTDPPPDLAIEADISHSSLNRMTIYAALRVAEVWRFDGEDLEFHILQPNGEYAIEEESRAFPGLRSKDLLPFLKLLEKRGANEVIRQFRSWIRRRLKHRP